MLAVGWELPAPLGDTWKHGLALGASAALAGGAVGLELAVGELPASPAPAEDAVVGGGRGGAWGRTPLPGV